MREIDADFAAWARARQLRLLRAAWLVGGDAARAERQVLSVLTRLAAHWRHLREREPDAYVRVRLHQSALRAAEGDAHAGTVPRELPLQLRALAPRRRAVLVLRWYAGRSVSDTAELVGISSEMVRRDERLARASLSSAAGRRRAPAGRARCPRRVPRRTSTRRVSCATPPLRAVAPA